eukprot:2297330-Rhodomonas_salina.1
MRLTYCRSGVPGVAPYAASVPDIAYRAGNRVVKGVGRYARRHTSTWLALGREEELGDAGVVRDEGKVIPWNGGSVCGLWAANRRSEGSDKGRVAKGKGRKGQREGSEAG